MDRTSEAIIKIEDLELRVGELERILADGGGAPIPVLFLTGTKPWIGTSSFGNIMTDGTVAALVTFSGASTSLRFKGKVLCTGTPPLIALISGQGKLDLSNIRDGAKAIILGKCIKL